MREQQAFTCEEKRNQYQRSTQQQRRTNGYYPPANPHKAGHYSGLHPEDTPYTTGDVDDVEEDEELYTQRPHTSVKRYDKSNAQTQGTVHYAFHADQVQNIPPRRTAPPPKAKPVPEDVPVARPKRSKQGGFHVHWSVFLGLGMSVMLGLWIGGTSLSSWWQMHQDDVTYGRPRTAQYDVVVGHHDSPTNPTHLIALNLHSRVEIIEIPGGDVSKAKIYQGPQILGLGSDLYPVTLTFPQDANGKVDMQVHVQGDTFTYLNQNGQFVPQPTQ
jgi:hypothetical protein